jgi:cell division septation protein DedD
MSPTAAARVEETNDTEITLGTGKMLALFFGLVILCAIFFGMGYSMGRNSAKTGPELLPSPSDARPSAVNQAVSAPAAGAKTQEPEPAQTSSPLDNTSASSVNATQPAAAPDQANPQPPASGTGYVVQVAAVTKQEDAEALVEAFKARQYQALIANQPSDKLFHVQVGPFTDIKDAEVMRAKLVSDGYNPILKK